jgi:hypothetical protein
MAWKQNNKSLQMQVPHPLDTDKIRHDLSCDRVTRCHVNHGPAHRRQGKALTRLAVLSPWSATGETQKKKIQTGTALAFVLDWNLTG